MTTVGYGDIAPLTTAERIIAIIWMMVGVGFYSFTIGNLSTILAHIDRRSSALKVKKYRSRKLRKFSLEGGSMGK